MKRLIRYLLPGLLLAAGIESWAAILTNGPLKVTILDSNGAIDTVLFGGGAIFGDYYNPGTPVSDWGIQVGTDTTTFVKNNNNGSFGGTETPVTVTTSSDAIAVSGIYHGVNFTRSYSLYPGQNVLRVKTDFSNTGVAPIDLRYFDTFDPDQGANIGRGYYTYLDVFQLPLSPSDTVGVKVGQAADSGDLSVVMGSLNTSTIVSAGNVFGIFTGYDLNNIFASPADVNGAFQDSGLHIGLDLTLAPGESTSYVYDQAYGVTHGAAQAAFVAANQAPVAAITAPASVDELSSFTLDGSTSTCVPACTQYEWKRVDVTPALILSTTASFAFTAPNVASAGATLTFQLRVFDGYRWSDPAIANVRINDINNPPVAVAAVDAPGNKVQEGTLNVTINGSSSFDKDVDPLSYIWVNVSPAGSGCDAVAVSGDTSNPLWTFNAPYVGLSGATCTFKLTVSDSLASATDTVIVTVDNVNHPPVANAGLDQVVGEHRFVSLVGKGDDPDGDTLTYQWAQIAGPMVVLGDTASSTLGFTAPDEGPGGVTLSFSLTVTDTSGVSATDTVDVKVVDDLDPPSCNKAKVEPSRIWPPDDKLVKVKIKEVGEDDEDKGSSGKQVTLTVTGVTQDEATVAGRADAAIQGGNKLLVRAKRSSPGNGRVYRINFKAVDSYNQSCTGTVKVCVPVDGKKGSCTEDAGVFNSLQ